MSRHEPSLLPLQYGSIEHTDSSPIWGVVEPITSKSPGLVIFCSVLFHNFELGNPLS